jgi:nicotinamide-nucleotide amidase
MIADELRISAKRVLERCRTRGLKIATAESCTGGLVAAALTEVAGSSDVFERGFVTYSNEAKEALLGVPAATLERHGAVSRETAHAMADGALAHSPADIAVAITGVAGPGGGTKAKPVGLVHFAAAARAGAHIHRSRRFGRIGRRAVRLRSVVEALNMLERLVTGDGPTPPASRKAGRRGARTPRQNAGMRRRTSRP